PTILGCSKCTLILCTPEIDCRQGGTRADLTSAEGETCRREETPSLTRSLLAPGAVIHNGEPRSDRGATPSTPGSIRTQPRPRRRPSRPQSQLEARAPWASATASAPATSHHDRRQSQWRRPASTAPLPR